jgi:hypothetical protein
VQELVFALAQGLMTAERGALGAWARSAIGARRQGSRTSFFIGSILSESSVDIYFMECARGSMRDGGPAAFSGASFASPAAPPERAARGTIEAVRSCV